jgi:hypothetical protein
MVNHTITLVLSLSLELLMDNVDILQCLDLRQVTSINNKDSLKTDRNQLVSSDLNLVFLMANRRDSNQASL